MLATLNDLHTESIDEELVGIRGVIDEVDDGIVCDNVRGLFDDLEVILGDSSDRFVYEIDKISLERMKERGSKTHQSL